MTITYDTLEALYAVYTTAQDAGDFDAMRAAHIEYLLASGTFIGVLQTAYIVLLYGKEALNVHQQTVSMASPVESAQASAQAPASHTTEADVAAVARMEDPSTAHAEEAVGPSAQAVDGEKSAQADNRYTGTLLWRDTFGYITPDDRTQFMSDLRVIPSRICGRVPLTPRKSVRVEFSLSQIETMGWRQAYRVVIVGNAASEQAYADMKAPRHAEASTPTPRPDIDTKARQSNARERGIRRASKQDDAARRAANEKAMRDLFSGNF